MTVALIDNGSLEPAAHLNLRRVAAGLSERAGVAVHAVSWRHSDHIDPGSLDGIPASTLDSWMRTHFARGERRFILVPFFISPQGAIGSALESSLEQLRSDLGNFEVEITEGLADRVALGTIVAARIRECISAHQLLRPAVIVVDHGGPSPVSAELRNQVAAAIRTQLGPAVSRLAAASLEGAGHAHNHPLLAELLKAEGYDNGDVVIAPLFLSPGRHAGKQGDLARVAQGAERRVGPSLRCHLADLVGTHPLATEALATAMTDSHPGGWERK